MELQPECQGSPRWRRGFRAANVVLSVEDRAGANGQRRCRDIAFDLRFRSNEHGPAAEDCALDLPAHDQPAAEHAVADDHVTLLFDRYDAERLDRSAGLIFIVRDVVELERLVTELARDAHRLAADLLRLAAIEASDRLAIVGRGDGVVLGHESIVGRALVPSPGSPGEG